MSISVKTSSAQETIELGYTVGRLLKPGDVVCLYGELGAGKTTFIKGVARALGIDEKEITSASFVIIAEHYGEHPLYHIDLYRIEGEDSLFDTGVDEYLQGDGICLIEWAERLNYQCSLSIKIEVGDKEERAFSIEGPEERITNLKKALRAWRKKE